MEYLLDTCALLDILSDSPNLNKNIRKIINNPKNHFFISTFSTFEIIMKHNKKPELMPISGVQLLNAIASTDISELPPISQHYVILEEIIKQNIHHDPFDLMIIATAKEENMPIITRDKTFTNYSDIQIVLY